MNADIELFSSKFKQIHVQFDKRKEFRRKSFHRSEMIQFIDEIIVENPRVFLVASRDRGNSKILMNRQGWQVQSVHRPFFPLADSFYFSSLSFPFFSFPPTD